MIFGYPVIDRSQSDVELAKSMKERGWNNLSNDEKEEWSKGLKGALNLKDIHRVVNNIRYIAKAYNINVILSDIPDVFINEKYLREIETALMLINNNLESTPVLPYNVYEKWNEIESILKQKFEMITENKIKTQGETAYRLGFRVGSDKGVFKI